MIITINGKQEDINEKVTLLDFLKMKGLNPDTIIIEHNCNILKKEQLVSTKLNANDTLEIIRFVGGG